MELGTIIGIVAGLFFTLFSIYWAADFQAWKALTFIDPASVMITVGGAFASTFIAIKFDKLIASFKAIGIVFKPPVLDPAATIEKIVALANTARKEGVLALEDSAEAMDDAFLKKGIMLVVDANEPELVKGIMETELAYIDERHGDIAATYEYISSQGPAWGMIGTLIGLILMLLDMNDPSLLGPKMAVALITTFYGSLMSNFLATPIANKMKMISKEEILLKTVMIEGMLSIQNGENPRIIEEKLNSFLSPALRDSVNDSKQRKEDPE